MLERSSFERELANLGVGGSRLDAEVAALAAATTPDPEAAEPPFAASVRSHIEPLPSADRVKTAKAKNTKLHPGVSGVDAVTLQSRLGTYLDVPAVERAIAADAGLSSFAGDAGALLAVCAQQFQRKIYQSPKEADGVIGEGTLDALGFVRHRGSSLNRVDSLNEQFHAGKDGNGKSAAYERVEEVYRTSPGAFASLGSDVKPATWFCLYVNAPFLGWTFNRGIHVELLRRLRRAQAWLMAQPQYKGLSPVELGKRLGVDERHTGGRAGNASNPTDKRSASMHTFGLATDIGYDKNPWVAGNPERPKGNLAFRAISKRVSALLSGTDEELSPAWLSSLGNGAARSTADAYDRIQVRHSSFLVYLGLAADDAGLRTSIVRRQNGLRPDLVLQPGESVDAAVKRWRSVIIKDAEKLKAAFGGRDPHLGFLNLARDLVIALRDHGCLAWGAIDIGPRESGDMMHFDCRADGVGRALLPPRGAAVGRGHPCFERADREAEVDTTPVTSAHLGGQVVVFRPSALALDVAVFIPAGAARATEVDVLLFAHGLNRCGATRDRPKGPADFITGRVFRLGKLVDAAKRPTVLVVPWLDWEHRKQNHMDFSAPGLRPGRQHKLSEPETLNAVLAEALAQVGAARGSAGLPGVSRLIVAGHSRAYDFLDALAVQHTHASMASGVLGKLSHVWALDTTYTFPARSYAKWLEANPSLRMAFFYRDVPLTRGGGRAAKGLVRTSGGRLEVTVADELHCSVPRVRLPKLLDALR